MVYTNSKGERWENTVRTSRFMWRIAALIIAQVAALIRAEGITPLNTDYIEGVRRGRVTAE